MPQPITPWSTPTQIKNDQEQGLWRCQDGRVIPIKDMEEKHLRNSINMLKRGAAIQICLEINRIATVYFIRDAVSKKSLKSYYKDAIQRTTIDGLGLKRLKLLLEEAKRRSMAL